MKIHEENIQFYLENGGDHKIANRHKLPTLQNRAKISYLISQQKPKESITYQDEEKKYQDVSESNKEEIQPTMPEFIGFISQYPTELHSAYQDCYNAWIKVCSYKIQLNDVVPLDVEDAYKLQLKIFKSISKFDRFKNSLDYWNDHKRILPTESKKDYSNYTPLELDQERRNLASLICRRRQTIEKKEKELPVKSDPNYNKKYIAIQFKKEQLEELILDENKIVTILKSLATS